MDEKLNQLYVNNDDNTVRYVLGKYNENPMIVFGINPSTASDTENDKTISKIERIAEYRGKDGYLMLNIYPVRATKINNDFAMEADSNISERNLREISGLINEGEELVAAWGTHIKDRKFFMEELDKINEIVKSKNAKWLCLSKTKYGHPRHPLYLSYSKMTFEEFDMDEYIQLNK